MKNHWLNVNKFHLGYYRNLPLEVRGRRHLEDVGFDTPTINLLKKAYYEATLFYSLSTKAIAQLTIAQNFVSDKIEEYKDQEWARDADDYLLNASLAIRDCFAPALIGYDSINEWNAGKYPLVI